LADNKLLPPTGSGTANITAATRSVTYSGDTADVQVVGLAAFSGSDDAKTVTDITASGSALNVQPTSLSATILATVVTVGTSAVTLPASALSGRRSVTIQSDPTNTAYIYIGSSAVTADAASTGGFMLAPGQSLPIDLAAGLVVYGRSTSASQAVRVLEFA
jgi:hypothetical protein